MYKKNTTSFSLGIDWEDGGLISVDNGLSIDYKRFASHFLYEHKYLLEKVIKPGMTILDIGPNIGYYPLMELNLIGKIKN